MCEDKYELDITAVDDAKLAAIREVEAQIVSKTRQEKGLVEANLQVLSLIETAPPSRKARPGGATRDFRAESARTRSQAEAP